jgi:cytoskeletal protein RodZ
VSNVEKHPTPIGDGIAVPDTTAEAHESSPSIAQERARPSSAASDDDLVGTIQTEEAILRDRAREPIDPKPLIETMEALSRGIRKELELARDRASGGPAPVFGGELGPLIEAAQGQIRRMRNELGLAEPVGLAAPARPPNEKRGGSGADPELAKLEPLIEVFAAQVRGIRQELGHTEAGVEKPQISPRLPETVPQDSGVKETAVDSSLGSGRDEGSRRRLWLLTSAAALVGVALIGGWLAWNGRLRSPAVARPLPSSTSASTGSSTPTTQAPTVAPLAESTREGTASAASRPVNSLGTSGNEGLPASPGVGRKSDAARDPAAARSSVVPPEPVAITPPVAATESGSSVGTTSSAAPSDVPRPSTTPDAAADRPNAGAPVGGTSSRDALASPNAGPPAGGLARPQ